MLINRCSEIRSSLREGESAMVRRKCNAARDATGLSIAEQIINYLIVVQQFVNC